MTKMIVVTVGDKDTRFDREYYSSRHLALALQCWGPYGLETADAFYPVDEAHGWLAIGIYGFGTPQQMDAALASPETERIMSDVKHFTDATTVIRSVFSPL